MKYFLNETERKATNSTCYFEFQQGRYKNRHWLNSSLCMHADVFDELMLYDLFSSAVENFNYYGPNIIDKTQWNAVVAKSRENEQWNRAIAQLKPWVEECFAEYKCFTVCGI